MKTQKLSHLMNCVAPSLAIALLLATSHSTALAAPLERITEGKARLHAAGSEQKGDSTEAETAASDIVKDAQK